MPKAVLRPDLSCPLFIMPLKIKNKTYQALLFDVDDTLIDTSQSYDEAIKKTVKNAVQIEVSDEQINLVRSHGMAYGVNNDWHVTWLLIQLVKHFSTEQWKMILTEKKMDAINPNSAEFIEIKAFFQNLYLGNPPFNGQGLIDTAEEKIYTEKFFPTLKTLGIKIAVVTSRPTDEAFYTLNHVNALVGEFIESEDLIISAGSQHADGQFIAEKPSPEPILECVKRVKVGIKESVYVGNSSSDYLAAKEAGVDFIQVGNSQIERDNEPKGFHYFKLNSVNDILSLMING
ncbi:MAG: HAD hydrolase-like protein [Candidatus Parabeggiatoa sp.]|nr:HAD hydrolase-like protein [Candidatus Parabeggiatoa sp.]